MVHGSLWNFCSTRLLIVLILMGMISWQSYVILRNYEGREQKTLSVEVIKHYMVKNGRITENDNKFGCIKRLKSKIVECLINNLKPEDQIWKVLTKSIDTCTKFLQKTLPAIRLVNKDDEKFVLMPDRQNWTVNDECTSVTIGVGNDIEAEKQLKSVRPSCNFFGSDPIFQSGKVFNEIGTYVERAIVDKNSYVVASVLENNTYMNKNVSAIDFFNFIKMTKTDKIDYLFLDAEGAEYPILKMLKKSTMGQTVICQISIEIHGFAPEYRMTESEFSSIILDLLHHGSYLPVYGTYYEFNRMFWVDFESPYCLETYFSEYCLF